MKTKECIIAEFDRITAKETGSIRGDNDFFSLMALAWVFLNGPDTIDDLVSRTPSELRIEMEECLEAEREINQLICDGKLAAASDMLKEYVRRWPNSPEALHYGLDIRVAGTIAKEFNDDDSDD